VIGVLICFVVMLALQLVTPYWWWVILVPLVYCCVRGRSTWGSVLTGLASAGLLWLLAGAYAWATGSEIILSRIAVTMMVGSPAVVLLMTAVLAAAAGALAGGAGYSLRAAFAEVEEI
jgi:hypothetical protein